MRKLRLAVVLPIIQVVLATMLLHRAGLPDFYVPTSKLICLGLNAPAWFFMLLNPISWGPAFDWLPRSMLGIDTGDLFFLLGVIVVWYFVGRVLDHRGTPEPKENMRMAIPLIVHILLLVVGGVLLLVALQDFQHPHYGGFGIRPQRAMLTFLWSAILIFISGRALARATRRGLARSG